MSAGVFDLSNYKSHEFESLKDSFCRTISNGIAEVKSSIRVNQWNDEVGVLIYESLVDLANKTLSVADSCRCRVSAMRIDSDIDSMSDDYERILHATDLL